jgi:site-specific DNA-methyltransferase (adenine-specific)/adenine-specific DNA-methyltransferase
VSEERLKELDRDGRIYWGKDGNSVPAPKIFLSEVKQGVVPQTILHWREVGHTQDAKKELLDICDFEDSRSVFITPKPVALIRRLLQVGSDKDSLILDSFAGSGTTGHAVLAQNVADGGRRHFICVEMDKTICQDVTAQRMRKAIQGYDDTPGLGGGFRFCKLGNPLFDEAGSIASEVRFSDLAAHVFFTETGSPVPKRAEGKTPLLGVHQGKAVYLLFNGALGDKRSGGGNILTHDVAQDLPKHPDGKGPRVVYGEACRLGAKSLEHYRITFRQIPYELKVD